MRLYLNYMLFSSRILRFEYQAHLGSYVVDLKNKRENALLKDIATLKEQYPTYEVAASKPVPISKGYEATAIITQKPLSFEPQKDNQDA